MARADAIRALIDAHAQGNNERFFAVAMQLAAQEARQGHFRVADQLKEAVDRAKKVLGGREHAKLPGSLDFFRPRGELAGLLAVAQPDSRLSDMSLEDLVAQKISRILSEQRQCHELEQHGLMPIRRVLLVGPPGTGKTMTAAVLAGELRLPLFTVQLHALISRFLGETAAKLRLIFDAIERVRGVYLFDEFDALATHRAAPNEVGEIRRVLNSFLQFMEVETSTSLVVAASNHPELLDRAVFRRFDMRLEYELPTPGLAVRLMRVRLSHIGAPDVDWSAMGEAARGLSHADITRACDAAAKAAILSGKACVSNQQLGDAIMELKRAGD